MQKKFVFVNLFGHGSHFSNKEKSKKSDFFYYARVLQFVKIWIFLLLENLSPRAENDKEGYYSFHSGANTYVPRLYVAE